MRKKMTMMTKIGMSNSDSLQKLFNMQKEFQARITGLELPLDSTSWFQYHMTAMIEELGEVLKADKRWKTHRNTRYVPDEKMDEIADCFITLINIAMYSGFDCQQIVQAIENKIIENMNKL